MIVRDDRPAMRWRQICRWRRGRENHGVFGVKFDDGGKYLFVGTETHS